AFIAAFSSALNVAAALVDAAAGLRAAFFATVLLADSSLGFVSASGSAPLLHAQQVAGGIAHGAVTHAVGLHGRFLHDLGAAGLDLFERSIEVLGRQQHDRVGALGHHLGDGALLLVGDAGAGVRREQHDGGSGLLGWTDGDPAQAVVAHVVAHLEAEGVAVERQRGVRVGVREEAGVDADVHGGTARCGRSRHARSGSAAGASPFLIGCVLTGRVTCRATHDGRPAVARAASRRYTPGETPTSSAKRVLKVPSEAQPTV